VSSADPELEVGAQLWVFNEESMVPFNVTPCPGHSAHTESQLKSNQTPIRFFLFTYTNLASPLQSPFRTAASGNLPFGFCQGTQETFLLSSELLWKEGPHS
jgi:hypothetical protein